MPRMTRTHYNLVADATAQIIEAAMALVDSAEGFVADKAIAARMFKVKAAQLMTDAVAGTNSQFKADRFKDRCLGIRRGR